MKKRHAHNEMNRALIFGVAALVSALLFVMGLVGNSNGAVDRYNALIATDKAGGNVEQSLNDLRSYIHSHMNSEIGGGPNGIYPPIQLSGTYDRLIQQEEQRVSDINSALDEKAIQYCEENGPSGFSGINRIDCVNKYKDENGAKIQQVEESLYKYSFTAPRWSADLAGFSLLALIVFLMLTVFNLFMYYRTKHIVDIAN